jgi:hypothetical protein
MNENYKFTVVRGYHQDTPVPNDAKDLKLSFRLALVLPSTKPFSTVCLFDEKQFFEIVRKVISVIKCDSVVFDVDDQKKVSSLEGFESYIAIIPEDDKLPPKRTHFLISGNIVAMEETEFWAFCGGPDPYHDSWTLSFYTKIDLSLDLVTAFALALDCDPSSINLIEASTIPVRKSIWKR